MSASYYSSSIPDFLLQSSSEVLGLLANAHRFALEQTQRDAWVSQIMLLKRELAGIGEGEIHFEFVIPRMGKRADCIVVYRDVVFVLEFKVGSSQVDRAAIEQVHDYALDLKNFHRGSHSAVIIPVMIATKAITKISKIVFAADLVAKPVPMGSTDLRNFLDMVLPIDAPPPRLTSICGPTVATSPRQRSSRQRRRSTKSMRSPRSRDLMLELQIWRRQTLGFHPLLRRQNVMAEKPFVL